MGRKKQPISPLVPPEERKQKRDHVRLEERVRQTRRMLDAGMREYDVLTWARQTHLAVKGGTDGATVIVPAKTWKASQSQAVDLLRRAKEMAQGEDARADFVKRAENRSRLDRLFSIAAIRAESSDLALREALKSQHMINMIDGSYEASKAPPPGDGGMSEDEAVAVITHAHSTLELARARGALVAPGPVVVDATAVDVDDDEDGQRTERGEN